MNLLWVVKTLEPSPALGGIFRALGECSLGEQLCWVAADRKRWPHHHVFLGAILSHQRKHGMLFLFSFTCPLTPHTLPTSWCVCNRPSWGQNTLHYTNQGSQKTLANGHPTQLLFTSFFLFLFPLPSTSPRPQGSHLFLSSFLDTEFKFQHLYLLTAWNWATSLNSLWPHFLHLENVHSGNTYVKGQDTWLLWYMASIQYDVDCSPEYSNC